MAEGILILKFDDFIKLLRELIDLLLGHHGRVHLHLKVHGAKIVKIGGTATATISPTPAGTTVTNVVYDSDPTGFYTVVPAADGLSAVYTATAVGTGINATVSAMNADGVTLTDKAGLPDVTTGAATALNLTVVENP